MTPMQTNPSPDAGTAELDARTLEILAGPHLVVDTTDPDAIAEAIEVLAEQRALLADVSAWSAIAD